MNTDSKNTLADAIDRSLFERRRKAHIVKPNNFDDIDTRMITESLLGGNSKWVHIHLP